MADTVDLAQLSLSEYLSNLEICEQKTRRGAFWKRWARLTLFDAIQVDIHQNLAEGAATGRHVVV